MLFKGTEYLYFGEGLSDGEDFQFSKSLLLWRRHPSAPFLSYNVHPHTHTIALTHPQKKCVCSCSSEIPKFTQIYLHRFVLVCSTMIVMSFSRHSYLTNTN